VNVQTTDKKHTVHTTLKSFQEKLPENKFYKVHNNYLVAIDRIDNVQDNLAYVGRHNLPIDEQFKPGLLRKLNLVQ
jgi:DNA-binding LytR/AlgR family response regulator